MKLLGRLRDVCSKTRREFINEHNKTLRIHPIKWSKVTESSFGTHVPEHDADAWQFSISQNKHGRVHGFFY